VVPIEEVAVFAKTIWGEARGEPIEGMLGVAWTIKNRADRPRWPNTLIDVCLQPAQFSIWNPKDPNFKKVIAAPLASPAFYRAVFVALGVVLGYLNDPTNGADHYHTKEIDPSWNDNMTVVAEIGNHIFYRDD